MGNFYTNYTLHGPSQQAVAAILAGRSALVTPEQDGFVVVFDEESDEQNVDVIAGVAAHLSGELHCAVLAVMNHDDDIFWYQLYVNGGLEDEYDSCPNYFSATDEEIAPPSGGDAQTLCGAFGATNFKRVERILRKSKAAGRGYTFEVERHADLVAALGLPSFSAGAGFRHLAAGEPLEGLTDEDLVRTADLALPKPNSQPRVAAGDKIVPGYYKVRFAATNPVLPFRKPFPAGWMPHPWAELECAEGDLSAEFRRATDAARGKFKQLGFMEIGFKRVSRTLSPDQRDNGGINYLDQDRCHFGQLIYSRFSSPSSNVERENLTIAFTVIFESRVVSISNDVNAHFGESANHRVIRIKSDDVVFIYGRFLDELGRYGEKPRRFAELQSLRDWFDASSVALFEERVRRGVFVRMSDYEAAAALRKLKPADT